jgi:hypothetical protein
VAAALLKRQYIGIDQSEEYVCYARKRLEHALSQSTADAVVDPTRASKVMTRTDAFGRQRVPRRRAVKSA